MAAQRFLPDTTRTRRTVGVVFAVVGLAAVAGLRWLGLGSTGVNVTTAVFLGLPAAFAALGLYLALRLPLVLEIDPANRSYALIRDGAPSDSGPLDALAPLSVSRRTRQIRTKNGRRTVVEYVVNAGAHSSVDLFVTGSPGRARQKLESLGRAWHLPCISLGGDLRAPEDLDKPLHQRVRIDPGALAPMPLKPEWGLRVEPLSPGYALVSNHRSWQPLASGALLLVPVPFVLMISYNAGLWGTLLDAGGDLLGRVLAALMGVVVLALLFQLGRGARDTFFPGTVRVTERGVAYRGRRMPLSQIEEVTAGLPVEIVGDRRILRLAVSFCPPEATEAVAFEIQRLILQVAPRGPLGV